MSKIRISALPDPADPPVSAPADPAERITFLIVPRFNLATLITLIEPLRVANYLASQPLYQWEIVAFDGTEIAASNGMTVSAAKPPQRNRRGETVFVLASWGGEDYANREALAWLRRQSREGARLCAVELGAYLLARAGLLAGRQTAVHWSWAPGFQERYPDVPTVERLYTLEDPGMSCAGGTAGMDLMLHLIARRHGATMAAEVADQMLTPPARAATAPQRRSKADDSLPSPVARAVALIEAHIAEPLAVPDIAARVGLSQRQLERQFQQAIGCSVVQFGALVRLQHARVLLISTRLSVRDIAAAAGFNALSHFSHAFRGTFGRRPGAYRQAWPEGAPTPSWPGTLAAFLESRRKA